MTTFKRRTGQADSLVQSVLVEAVTKSQSKTHGDSPYFVCSLTKITAKQTEINDWDSPYIERAVKIPQSNTPILA